MDTQIHDGILDWSMPCIHKALELWYWILIINIKTNSIYASQNMTFWCMGKSSEIMINNSFALEILPYNHHSSLDYIKNDIKTIYLWVNEYYLVFDWCLRPIHLLSVPRYYNKHISNVSKKHPEKGGNRVLSFYRDAFYFLASIGELLIYCVCFFMVVLWFTLTRNQSEVETENILTCIANNTLSVRLNM